MLRTMFFATRGDIITLLEQIERNYSLIYYPFGRFPDPSVPKYASASQIPSLGVSPSGTDDTDPRYLILSPETHLILRKNKYVTDQLFVDHDYNPSAVVILPGGTYGDGCIIQGAFLAKNSSDAAVKLLKLYRRDMRLMFHKIADCYIGPDAYEKWQGGSRLTDSVAASPDRDLRLPAREDF
ncbi:hypothetical protein [Tuwongella immobilis]|uniref:Uncharacterized protein n=1 Tax=Tuwongella immobilis TaxID=692036 RepID=A0A6C2YUB3_9BACT|nr:hypothetical protein [Tuwongella immobilis]VIP05024.1 Uncharacterized protein OS=Mesorhizobium sp. LSJC280B00 GN=X772_27490 PE=4 SV=1 [Tuwongella immobilis]VTS07406.1 Uncharacterized protein OS=Mesorhizobium sp. LSJC280B00 GN=X772_27490 PE=4 SV=1 [Tuwongella immobilis]